MWAKTEEEIPIGVYITYLGGYVNTNGTKGVFLGYEKTKTSDWIGLRWGMSDTFINVDELKWRTTKINRYIQEGPEHTHKHRFELEMFEPYASWDALDMWEDERLASMQKHIRKGDVLWEIGAEMGLFAAIFSKYMTDKLVLIEPTAEFWPGIKALFDKNKLKEPLMSWAGFVGTETCTIKKPIPRWPQEALQDDVIEKRKYRNLYDPLDVDQIKTTTVDTLQKLSLIDCDHVSIDVEGAELLVLLGAEKTLRTYHPKVWCSVHPDMMERDYGHTEEDLLFFMDDCGYDAELLAVDHEKHFLFTKKV